jgi:L-alanine-DL-glutamate epimerase-like enolase superfamily enzyme
MIEIENRIETWPLAAPFRITDQVYHEIKVVVTTVRDGVLEGRGEAAGVDYLGETPASIIKQIEGVKDALREPDRAMLQCLLPTGGARNALDCAFWELEAARLGRPAWRLAGLMGMDPRVTTYTIGAATPADMAERALAFSGARALKLKLTGDGEDAERVGAVRAARPDVWLGVDANQGFSMPRLEQLMPEFLRARVALIEQPLPVELDSQLESFISPIPLAADESVQGMASLERLPKGFSVVNIKLDKCGGLTEALAMVRAARALGLKVMVGNMLGTSLAMAPAFLVGQLCDVLDLDGPVLLQHDRDPGALYREGQIWCSDEVWGAGEERNGSAGSLMA